MSKLAQAFFPMLIDFLVPVVFSKQVHVWAYSTIHCYDSDLLFASLQIWIRNLDSILDKNLGFNDGETKENRLECCVKIPLSTNKYDHSNNSLVALISPGKVFIRKYYCLFH